MKQNDTTQSTLWNGTAGHAWVQAQDLLDEVFTQLQELLVEALRDTSVSRVLDVGCGTGGTTVAIARALGAPTRCTGVDISEPMIDAARARADRAGAAADFVVADAQHHTFGPGAFDAVVSRFGVMFFDDPVRAFANLRHAATDNAALRLLVWRGPEDNPFMTTAEHAAAPLLPDLPARDPDAPGQFAFADDDRVRRILGDGGWTDIEVRPVDVPCRFPESGLRHYVSRLGPLGRVLPDLDEPKRGQVIDVVRAAFEPFVHGDQVRFDAACWLVSATGGSTGR